MPVSALLTWLGRTDREAAAALLVGCALDDGESDDLAPIEGFDAASATLTLAGGRRVSLRRVAQGAIVDRRPGRPLPAAIEAAQTPAERHDAALRAALRARRVDPDSLGSVADREQVLGFLEQAERGEVPPEPALRAFYEAMKPAAAPAKHRRAAEALEALLALCAQRGTTPPSLPWRLAWFLNQLGRFADVVALSETPQGRAVHGMHRAYLATIRASALLALAGIRYDARLLDKAEAALKIAEAIDGGSDEVKGLYRALHRIRARR